MSLSSSLKERAFELWMDSSNCPTSRWILQIFQPWMDSSNFIGKLPQPPWKSRWVLTWILGLQAGLILDCFGLGVIYFVFDFDLGVSRVWIGCSIGSHLGFDQMLTWESFDLDLGSDWGFDLWLGSRLRLWYLILTFELVSIMPWLGSRLDLGPNLTWKSFWASLWAWLESH